MQSCKWGHTEGYYNNGHCKACAREHSKRWEQANRERRIEQARIRFLAKSEESRTKQREASRRWKQANPEKADASTQRWRENNPEKYAACVKRNKRIYNLKIKYGLTPAEYDALVTAQKGLCAICKERKRLHVDHCHNTNVRRGLLCDTCNMGLGLFYNEPERLRAAANYLELQT